MKPDMKMKRSNQMKENKERVESEAQEHEGTSRRGFIARTLFAGASFAAGSLALAASQNQASAQTGKRNKTKSAANSLGSAEAVHSCSDRAGVAAGTEAVDSADSRHDEAAPPGGEHRGGRNRIDARRPRRDRNCRLEDSRAGGALPRTPATNDRPLSGRVGKQGKVMSSSIKGKVVAIMTGASTALGKHPCQPWAMVPLFSTN